MKMMEEDDSDITVLGHFSIDNILLPNRQPVTILGGAVAYVSFIARTLGASASIISKVGYDFPEAYMLQLEQVGIDTSHIITMANERTTSYELTYNQDLSSRKLKLRNQGSPITLDDLPCSFKSKIIHIAPIASEINYRVVERIRDQCKYLSIDPQGFTRQFDKQGNVASYRQIDKRILSLADIYKSSIDEIETLTRKSNLKEEINAVHELGPKIVIATSGAKGSTLSVQGEVFEVPAFESTSVVDPTGAGDVFIGAYLSEFIREKEPFWCACVGAASASIVVEGVGTSFFGNKAEIYRRANDIYKRKEHGVYGTDWNKRKVNDYL